MTTSLTPAGGERIAAPPPIDPPDRLLTGPGPSNVDPRVVEAMRRPMLGHLDPVFHEYLAQMVDMLSVAYRRDGGLSIALSMSGSSGMEAGLFTLLEPGETAVVASAGFFGRRIADSARRAGARVVEVTAPFGEAVPNERIVAALARHPDARLVAVVHAETSTGVLHPLAELAAELAGGDALLLVDCVTSFGGSELEAGAWGIDYAFACTQKCLGAPPGIAPVSLSDRARDRIRTRTAPVPLSWDFDALARYWIDRPAVYHHTTPNIALYALHEALRLALEEGLAARWARHAEAGGRLQAGLAERGFELLSDPAVTLPQLSAVKVPAGVDGPAVQRALYARHSIEVGGGLGADAPPIWRIGLMGTNATRETADRVLEALDDVLPQGGRR
jgi:alanine-glyoxylate transaminase/serine-glyoxylate transaminase/serine-pyruvate transaminase